MRKDNREIKDLGEITDLIRNLSAIRLGINDEKYPYIVPVSFGWELAEGRLMFYFHGAKEGKKAELLRRDPHVCVEGDIFYRYLRTARSVTCLYESVTAFGEAELLTGADALHGLRLILEHCGYKDCEINEAVAAVPAVYRVTVDSSTGKCRDKHN